MGQRNYYYRTTKGRVPEDGPAQKIAGIAFVLSDFLLRVRSCARLQGQSLQHASYSTIFNEHELILIKIQDCNQTEMVNVVDIMAFLLDLVRAIACERSENGKCVPLSSTDHLRHAQHQRRHRRPYHP